MESHRAKITTSVPQIYLLLPCQTGLGFPGTSSTWVICGAAAAEVTPCTRRTWSSHSLWPKKGTRDKKKKQHQRQAAVLSIRPALAMTGLLHCSYQHTRVQGQPWCTHWKLTLPGSCSQHSFKPRLPVISSYFVYHHGASGQTKKEPHCAQRHTEMLN